MPAVIRNVAFETRYVSGELRIVRIDPSTPFVSSRAIIDWLKAKLVSQKDARGRGSLEAAIQALEAQNTGTPASK
jgi:hypothetical protein